jgi:hypothetical protein
MNERIKELALEAGKYADETQPRGSYTRDGMWLYAYNEKFAELVVRECARVAIEKQTENDINNIVSKNPAKDFAYALIKHFGVEE